LNQTLEDAHSAFLVLAVALALAKDGYTCFVELKEAFDWIPHEKHWGALQDYDVDGRHPFSECQVILLRRFFMGRRS